MLSYRLKWTVLNIITDVVKYVDSTCCDSTINYRNTCLQFAAATIQSRTLT